MSGSKEQQPTAELSVDDEESSSSPSLNNMFTLLLGI
jgi:hypothetical protein